MYSTAHHVVDVPFRFRELELDRHLSLPRMQKNKAQHCKLKKVEVWMRVRTFTDAIQAEVDDTQVCLITGHSELRLVERRTRADRRLLNDAPVWG